MFPSKHHPRWQSRIQMLERLTWETVAVCAALLHVVAHLDTTVDVIHGVQHLALKETKKLEGVRKRSKYSPKQAETKASCLQGGTVNAAQGCCRVCEAHHRLMLCSWDPAGSSCSVTFPASAVRSLSTTAVMSAAQSSLSSREHASKKWSTPFFVWSLNTS